MSFPRYERYKDSGLPWLREIPSHWSTQRSRRMFALRKDRALEGDRQLTASQKHGVIYQDDYVAIEGQKVVQVIIGADILKHVEPKDFVISMRSFQGGIEWCGYRGCISSAYVVLIPSDLIDIRFFTYLFKCKPYIQALQSTSNLVRDGQALRFENFTLVDLPVVPLSEQRTIAAFLDHETAKIDALIVEQQRLIGLLNEKRQAVISHSVMKGVNPAAPTKHSGIGWLGEIPRHWDLRPLKYLATFRSGGTPDKARPDFWDGEVPWASAKDLKVNVLNDTEDHITEVAISSGAASLVAQGSLLVVVRGMILARMFPVVRANVAMAINQDLKAVLPTQGLNSDYLAWLLRGSEHAILSFLDEAAHGTKALRMDRWGSMRLPVPPLSEQAEIAVCVEKACASLGQLTEEADRGILLLQERRTALISAAVTGKIDVRGLAIRSPQKEAAA